MNPALTIAALAEEHSIPLLKRIFVANAAQLFSSFFFPQCMSSTTRAVAEEWFDALDKADYERALALLHPDIVWINVHLYKTVAISFHG